MRRALVLLAGVAVLAAGGDSRPQAATPQHPNVLIVETDDQTVADMSALPNVRRLIGGDGVTFDRSFVSYSLCCPSRATLLTGQYDHNDGVRGNASPDGGYYALDSTNTLAVWLQRAGYYTVLLGKYLNEYGLRDPTEIPPGWSEWHGLVDPSTYEYYGYTIDENGVPTTYCADRSPSCYVTDELGAKAVDVLRRRAGAAEPFFLWVAFTAPHDGTPFEPRDPVGFPTPVVPPRYRDAVAPAAMPMDPSFDEADVSDKPAAIRRLPQFHPGMVAAIREMWRQRQESLMAVDDAVKSIVDTLAATGQLDDTLILFTSDNGYMQGEHRMPFGKVVLYEPSIRVPLLIRGPGIPNGVHRDQLVANVDYAPTILQATGAQAGRVEDGISLLPFVHDPSLEVGRDLLITNSRGGGFDAIRTRNWIYAEHRTGERELYDLRRDPYELRSLHDDTAYASLRASLAERLHVLAACAGDTCREAPAASLAVRCRAGAAFARVAGTGVSAVVFSVNGKVVARDRRPPFRARIRLPRPSNLVRARVEFAFDRALTRDAAVRACA